MDIETLVSRLGPEEYEALRRAVELGKWPDGRRLSGEDREMLMQAMIAWEAKHLPEHQRTGHMEAPDCGSAPEHLDEHTPLKWLH
jgi:uncharacterized protein